MTTNKLIQLALIAAAAGGVLFLLNNRGNGDTILQKATNLPLGGGRSSLAGGGNGRSSVTTGGAGGFLNPVVNPLINDEPTAFNEALVGITPVTSNPVARGTPVDDNILLFPEDIPRPRMRNSGSTSGFDVPLRLR